MSKTIQEALADCPKCRTSGCISVHLQEPNVEPCDWATDIVTCPDCNGTGYACGVAPNEVERHLFAIVEATRALRGEVREQPFSDFLDLCKAGEFDKAEARALWERGVWTQEELDKAKVDAKQLRKDLGWAELDGS